MLTLKIRIIFGILYNFINILSKSTLDIDIIIQII